MLNFLNEPDVKFDLHIHTTYSDGMSSVKEVIEQAEKLGLKYISITDHNAVNAYAELKKHNNYGFSGQIITGCEINTIVNGNYCEMLAYDFDYEKFKKFKFLSFKYRIKQNKKLLKEIVNKAKNYGFLMDKHIRFKDKRGMYYRELYNNLKKYPENEPLFKKLGSNSYRSFFRKQINSPKGVLYCLQKNSLPTPSQICDFVHKCGGKVVFAHPFYYIIDNPKTLLKNAMAYNIDGVECTHFSHSFEQMQYIYNLAKSKELLVTGGSDFHNKPRTVNNKQYTSKLGFLNIINKPLNTSLFNDLRIEKQ